MKPILAVFAVGTLGLLLSDGRSQAQPGKGAIDLNAPVIYANPKGPQLPSSVQAPNLQALQYTIAGLKDAVASLKKEVAALKTGLTKTSSSLDSLKTSLLPPKGYTTQYITKVNFDRVEGTALMKFYVRY